MEFFESLVPVGVVLLCLAGFAGLVNWPAIRSEENMTPGMIHFIEYMNEHPIAPARLR